MLKLKLKKLFSFKCRIPRRFSNRTRSFTMGRRISHPVRAEINHQEAPAPQPSLIDLFPATLLQVDQLRLRDKYGSRRKAKKSSKKRKKAKGLQYKLQYWKGVRDKERERKFTKQTRDSHESNDFVWTNDLIFTIVSNLVEVTLKEVKDRSIKDSATIAEAVAWIERRFDDSPFNFEMCCRFAGLDPELIREHFQAILKSRHGCEFPHYRVLRNGVIDAEAGDPDAIEWVLSEATTPLSFVDCCRALSFNPFKARAELLLPIVDTSMEAMTSDTDEELYGDLSNEPITIAA